MAAKDLYEKDYYQILGVSKGAYGHLVVELMQLYLQEFLRVPVEHLRPKHRE